MASKSPGCSNPVYSSCLSKERECLLCGAKDSQMIQYSNSSVEVRTFMMAKMCRIVGLVKKHLLEAQWHYSTSGYIPKWCKLPKQLTWAKCANSSCTGPAEH